MIYERQLGKERTLHLLAIMIFYHPLNNRQVKSSQAATVTLMM